MNGVGEIGMPRSAYIGLVAGVPLCEGQAARRSERGRGWRSGSTSDRGIVPRFSKQSVNQYNQFTGIERFDNGFDPAVWVSRLKSRVDETYWVRSVTRYRSENDYRHRCECWYLFYPAEQLEAVPVWHHDVCNQKIKSAFIQFG